MHIHAGDSGQGIIVITLIGIGKNDEVEIFVNGHEIGGNGFSQCSR